MKKIVLNISDSSYEKFRFEAIHEKKSVNDIIRDRLFHKSFHKDVQEAFDAWLSENLNEILNEK